MKVGIVVPCFNAVATIEATLLSLFAQSRKIDEIFVVDGGSVDGTLDILRKYEDKIQWLSEPDKGQTDAINKGFSRLSADIIKWVNADDLLKSNAIEEVVAYFQENPDVDFVYGDIEFIDSSGNFLGCHYEPSFSKFIMVYGHNLFADPACFWRCECLKSVGKLDINIRYSMDYYLWLRLLQKGFKFGQVPMVLAQYRIDQDNASIANHKKMRVEHYQICINLHSRELRPVPEKFVFCWLGFLLIVARVFKKLKILKERKIGKSFSFGSYLRKEGL